MTTTTDTPRAATLTVALRQARAELSLVEWENDPPQRVVDLFSTIDALLTPLTGQPEARADLSMMVPR